MGADKPNGVANYCRRPPQRPFLQQIQYAIWNPEERTFLGRTGKRWGVIGLIYLVMYICIIIFFSICMCGLLATMDERIPYFTLADSIIGDNPGMGHRPLVFEEGALIWYKADNATQVKKYVDNINAFLAPYENKSLLINGGVNQRECGEVKPPRKEVCAFNTSLLGPCSKENNYGYSTKTPCIIIKLNRLFDWNPDYYDDPGDLPPNIPPDITAYINSTTTVQQRRKVWVSCMGERPADIDALGPLKYWPYPGLPETFFPYDNTPGYLSPLVAVQLLKPTLHQIINIRCRAWARNVKYTESLKERLGSTHLEIMID
ncbi:sodium/potassium-transporting ATPase subunit beta-2-like [Achroia grisella]|uniref:sodium/potassium-transporting ATPase subunit beta-2-like n=1 Tax=Achroia grisella TaxID=688607 RepID=UPI0027D264D9|nr:sodium/potassium-transporting ATPase subunit beta-2-like [Achroia grisella]XP_059058976.1 sodium/potassium-transporting ATPase subunit beta-2-like [Achroia grisella]